jgi:hypothetical protein
MAGPERLYHRTGVERFGQKSDGGVQAPSGGESDEAIEPLVYLSGEIGHDRGNGACCH